MNCVRTLHLWSLTAFAMLASMSASAQDLEQVDVEAVTEAHDAVPGAPDAMVVDGAAVADTHHQAAAGLPQFDPTWFVSQLFWLTLSFTILYLLFSRKILPDLSSVLENRREHIQNDLETAERLKNEAEKAQATYEAGLENARIEAANIVGDMQAGLKQAAEKEAADFRARVESEVGALEQRISTAKSDAMTEMSSIAAEVASIAAKKIVGIDTDIKKAQTVVKALHDREAA